MLLAPFQPAASTRTLYWRRTFPGHPEQAHAVREFVASLLPDRPDLDELLLAVTELVANALRHTKSGQDGSFTVDILHSADYAAVSVTDEGGPREPVARDADVGAESGRGLRTVSLFADSWGWYGNDRGRTVVAVFADSERAHEQVEGCLRLSEETGDRAGEAAGLGQVGALHLGDGGAERALPVLNGALDIVADLDGQASA